MYLLLSYDGSYPGEELAHPGVNPGLVSLAAPDAPGENAGQLVSVLVVLHHHQGAAAVPLAGVLPSEWRPLIGPEPSRYCALIGWDHGTWCCFATSLTP